MGGGWSRVATASRTAQRAVRVLRDLPPSPPPPQGGFSLKKKPITFPDSVPWHASPPVAAVSDVVPPRASVPPLTTRVVIGAPGVRAPEVPLPVYVAGDAGGGVHSAPPVVDRRSTDRKAAALVADAIQPPPSSLSPREAATQRTDDDDAVPRALPPEPLFPSVKAPSRSSRTAASSSSSSSPEAAAVSGGFSAVLRVVDGFSDGTSSLGTRWLATATARVASRVRLERGEARGEDRRRTGHHTASVGVSLSGRTRRTRGGWRRIGRRNADAAAGVRRR